MSQATTKGSRRKCITTGACLVFVMPASLLILNTFYTWPFTFNSPLQPVLPMPKTPVRTALSVSEDQVVKDRFSDRRKFLKDECQKNDIRSWPINKIASRIEVLEDSKVFYCEVFKAGSTTWNIFMAHLYNHRQILHDRKYYKMIQVLKPNFRRFEEVIRSEQFLKFLVVREPLSRFLSAYRNRIEDTSNPSWQRNTWGPRILRETRGLRDDEIYYSNKSLKVVPTFEEFSRYMTTVNPETFDCHWIPIYLQCGVCALNYTHIVHMETFSEDILFILRESGIDQKIDLSLLPTNANKGRGDTDDVLVSYYSTLSPSTLQHIMKIYKEDFRLFGYDSSHLVRQISPDVAIKV